MADNSNLCVNVGPLLFDKINNITHEYVINVIEDCDSTGKVEIFNLRKCFLSRDFEHAEAYG